MGQIRERGAATTISRTAGGLDHRILAIAHDPKSEPIYIGLRYILPALYYSSYVGLRQKEK
jgi:hypothetical protein